MTTWIIVCSLRCICALKEEDPSCTYRKIASRLGLGSIGHITWILQGKRNLTLKKAGRFAELLNLNNKEEEYLKALISYTNTRSHAEKIESFERIASAQKSQKRIVNKEQYEYWSKWYYSAMRELVAIHKISSDYKEAARLLIPRITPAEAEKALKLRTTGLYSPLINAAITGGWIRY